MTPAPFGPGQEDTPDGPEIPRQPDYDEVELAALRESGAIT
ncbi:hypothetical protein FsymDg_3355 [Candidatus Protofrankia datiscae]|uniref:Uncharacterized protein n=1 Tax=Candidatus Protofrankia datiscae TaxID=2716812 RepID=F8B0M5_9ACTN|nr:hypothetical protein FsymDg_3355 [Candidatus Protofrankia datiscae]